MGGGAACQSCNMGIGTRGDHAVQSKGQATAARALFCLQAFLIFLRQAVSEWKMSQDTL